jgi:membrane-associated phospholipid phosphatase
VTPPTAARLVAWRRHHRGEPGSGPLTLALGYALFCVAYLGAAAWPLGTPTQLRPSAIDGAIPFLPWTVWIYLSQFPYLALVFRLAHGTPAWSRHLRAMLAATVASAAVFVVYPTWIPRTPIEADAATVLAFALLYGTDPAANCLPSLHVSLALLGAAGFWPERRRLALAAGAWATVIAVSTLTTRQHFVADVAAGALVALAAGWLARRFARGAPGPASHAGPAARS